MTKKKILFLTGTRADFSKLKVLIKKIDDCADYECYLFVTGMHMLTTYINL
jgi:UDP-N-acetylglucosamine 2-epimerase (hydrolysing)